MVVVAGAIRTELAHDLKPRWINLLSLADKSERKFV